MRLPEPVAKLGNVAEPWRLLFGSAINVVLAMVFVGFAWTPGLEIWSMFTDRPVVPPFSFMSTFEPPERNGYWLFLTLIYAATILLTAGVSRFSGASPGKAMLGVRFVTDTGGRPTFRALLRLTFATYVVLALIFLPGPVLGFVFGPAADPFSIISLLLGTITACLLGGLRSDGRVWFYRFAGIWPIVANSDARLRQSDPPGERGSTERD